MSKPSVPHKISKKPGLARKAKLQPKVAKPRARVRAAKAAPASTPAPVNAGASLTEMFVFGMSLGSEQRRPVLILKDSTGQIALPVWLSPIDASFALGDHSHEAHAAHSVALRLMRAFNLRLERCVFNDVKGHQQFVRLEFSGNEALKHLDARASDAMSICLAASVRFYAQADVIARSREVDAELLGIEAGLLAKPEIGFRNHKYVM